MFTVLTALTAIPDLIFGLDRRSPWSQLVAFRTPLLVGLLLLCVVLGVITVFRRFLWPFVAGGVVVLVVGSAMVLPRTIADPVPTTGTPFTVLAFNVYEGRADVNALAAEIQQRRPDIVSLEEAGMRFTSKITPLVTPLGYHAETTGGPHKPDVDGVTTLISNRLGDVRARIGDDEMSAFPYLELSGGALGPLHFVSFHSVAPTPGEVPHWRSDLAVLAQWCSGSAPTVIAGDFNATLDNSPMRAGSAGCGDAASQRGDGLIPTWGPTPFLRDVMGPQIDHIFGTPGIAAETFEVVELPGSDHRAILSTLRIPAT